MSTPNGDREWRCWCGRKFASATLLILHRSRDHTAEEEEGR